MARLIWVVALTLIFVLDAVANDWPQWRGPLRNGVSKETGLRSEWPAEGPPLRWKADDIGGGYSVAGDRQGPRLSSDHAWRRRIRPRPG